MRLVPSYLSDKGEGDEEEAALRGGQEASAAAGQAGQCKAVPTTHVCCCLGDGGSVPEDIGPVVELSLRRGCHQ